MPTIVKLVEGKVTALWGQALIRGLDGKMHPLQVGDLVHRGDVILTTQNGIVQIADDEGETRVATRLPADDLETAIKAINDGDAQAAPAAIGGGADGGAPADSAPGPSADASTPPAPAPAAAPTPAPAPTPTAVTLTASAATVTEGGSLIYTAKLAAAVTGSDLVITLSNGQTITIPVGSTSGSSTPFAVRADDAYVQGDQALTVGIADTNGGGSVMLDTSSTASAVVVDHVAATALTLTSSGAIVSEGGALVFTATVASPVHGSDLVVQLSNGQTITIPVGASSASSAPFAVRGDDAYVQGDQSLSIGVSGTTGGNFEALDTTSTAHAIVADGAGTTTTLTLTASAAAVAEGGAIVYTASVDHPVAGSDLVVTLSNGQTLTIPAGSSSASGAPFAVRGDDVYAQGDQTLLVGVTATAGGNYEALTTTSTATTLVSDDVDGTVLTLTASTGSATEGGSIVYTAAVNNAVTGSDLVVTLSNGHAITIPVGASSASSTPFTVRADDAYVQGDQTVTVAISSTSGGNYEAMTTSSTATSVVHDNADSTAITLTASSANVTEGGSIVYTAAVNNAVTGSDLVVALSNGQTITIPVGASSASSTPFAVRADDAYVEGDQAVTVGIANTSGGSYEALSTTSTATSSVHDNADATVVTFTASQYPRQTASLDGGGTYVRVMDAIVHYARQDLLLAVKEAPNN